MKKALILIIAMILAGCGTARPVLYPNMQVQQAGEARAQQDIDECTRKAEAYVKENPAGRRGEEHGDGRRCRGRHGGRYRRHHRRLRPGTRDRGLERWHLGILRRALPGRRAKPRPQAIRRALSVGERATSRSDGNSGPGPQAQGIRIRAGKSNPPQSPFTKGGSEGGFFGPADLWRTAGLRLPRRYRSSQ